MRFNVGDVVIGNAKANCYGITRQGWIGTVVSVRGDYIEIKGKSDSSVFDVLADRFDLMTPVYTNEDFENTEMKVFSRTTYEWHKAKYSAKYDQIIIKDVGAIEDNDFDILAIENDERTKYVKCANCGEILLNEESVLEAHAKRYESLDCCLHCGSLKKNEQSRGEDKVTKNEDGTYTSETPIVYKFTCRCNNKSIDESKQSVCTYKKCNTFKQLEDIHLSYPGLFDKLATLDSFDEKHWTYTPSNKTNCFIFKARKRFTLKAIVNNFGIVDYFEYHQDGGIYRVAYSNKYDKLFWKFDGGKWKDSASVVPDTRQQEIYNVISNIYKGDKK